METSIKMKAVKVFFNDVRHFMNETTLHGIRYLGAASQVKEKLV